MPPASRVSVFREPSGAHDMRRAELQVQMASNTATIARVLLVSTWICQRPFEWLRLGRDQGAAGLSHGPAAAKRERVLGL